MTTRCRCETPAGQRHAPPEDRAPRRSILARRLSKAAQPVPQACNHELNRFLPMAAPAATLQQELPYWLKPPSLAAALGRIGAAGPSSPLATNRNRNRQFFMIFLRGIIFITQLGAVKICSRLRLEPSFLVASIARTKVSTMPAIVSASPGVISPWRAPRSPRSSLERRRGTITRKSLP